MGTEQRPARVRKQGLRELVEIVCRLVDGETVDVAGEFFELRGAHVGRSVQDRLPILVGGSGERCSSTPDVTLTSSLCTVSAERWPTGIATKRSGASNTSIVRSNRSSAAPAIACSTSN